MKLKKDQFKKILKECIVELIDEGAFDKVLTESLQASPRVSADGLIPPGHNPYQQYAYQQPQQPGHEMSQQPFNHVGQLTPNDRLKELSKVAANLTSGGDPRQAKMLAGIFEDTAKTTYQKRLAAGDGGKGPNMYMGEQSTPEEDAADRAQLQVLNNGMAPTRWAAVAFANLGKKK